MPSSTDSSAQDFRSDPEYLRERRSVVRKNHPDVGGSSEQLIAALQELDEQWAARWARQHSLRGRVESTVASNLPPGWQAMATGGPIGDVTIRRSLKRNVARTAGRVASGASRQLRTRLPKGFPGAVRYAQPTSPTDASSQTHDDASTSDASFRRRRRTDKPQGFFGRRSSGRRVE